MKTLILALALAFSTATFAAVTVEADQPGSELQILDLVVGVKMTYSQTSELEAKVVELLGGDGMNPTRMVLILNTGYGEGAKIFTLGEMMVEATRITFLAKDVIVINYTQDSFDNAEDMNPIVLKKSMTIQVLRNEDGTLADKIKILE